MIELVNQNQASTNGQKTCSVTITGCTPGNILILAYAIRGDGNDPALSNGWTKLGGGNNVDTAGGLNQRLYFAYKKVEAETETVSVTQSTTARIYAVCAEFSGVTTVQMRDDLASYGATNYTVAGTKSAAEDIMVYGVTSAYYTSGRGQVVSPSDLTKIEGDSSAERLACWFDNGSGELEHSFSTMVYTEANGAVLECVQLFSYDKKYLIRSNSTLYTIVDGALTALAETEITASLFQTYGVDEIPDGALLVGLTDPEVLYWQDSTDELPTLSLTVKGAPPLPQMFTSEPMSLVHESIAGISHAAVDASEDVRFAISFDGGTTWKAFDGSAWFDTSDTVPGMLPSTMNAITAEQWAEVVVLESYMVRFWLSNVTAYVKSVVMHYINP